MVSDEADRIVYPRRLPNDPLQIRAALAPHREDMVGGVEATFNWYWLVDELMNDGYRVHLANPAAIRRYEGLKYSGDFTDAAHLAQLLRLGLSPEAMHFIRRTSDRERLKMANDPASSHMATVALDKYVECCEEYAEKTLVMFSEI